MNDPKLSWELTSGGMEASASAPGWTYEVGRRFGGEGWNLVSYGPGHAFEEHGHFETLAEALAAAEGLEG